MTAKPIVIGLTGSIGSGKSSVAKIWQELGAYLISADQLAREVVVPGSTALEEIRVQFGDQYLTSTGELDRKKLAALIFVDQARRKQLERILHPKIRALFRSRLKKALEMGAKVVVYEVPLLFESGDEFPELTHRVTVSAPEEQCIERICKRDGISIEQAKKRLTAQMPQAEKEQHADFVINNDSDLETLKNRLVVLSNSFS